jgi:hypothetical protein
MREPLLENGSLALRIFVMLLTGDGDVEPVHIDDSAV